MSPKVTQSGDSAAWARSGTTSARCLEGEGWWSKISVIRDWDCSRELMKAEGAWRTADLILRPPREIGSEAFSQAQSDRGAPIRSDKASLISASKADVAWRMWGGGQDLKMKLNLGKERQNRSKVVSIWESSRSRSLDTANLIFSTLDIRGLRRTEAWT